jgi:hypothetical protein
MLELDALVVNRIKTDATMISLMGINSLDDRIYAWYPAIDIEYILNLQEVAIIYRNYMEGREMNWSFPSQMPNIKYFFRILSVSQLKLRQCTERLIALFDQTSLTSANWITKWIELSSVADGMMEGSPTYPILSKNVLFTFNVVVRRRNT